ncbi:hypothetical protein D0907_20810 (plasmid) [Pseudoalteromonas lipolytica]|uniref:Uncharacterized protein n=1 Tax=Pseudoalteromonas lipolytica TaxID=570156 RepID=A0AAD0S4T9_9GAMM|nr:hypothetical protein [Pseudoalteromonas donghaensis]AXV67771.1 hypothetical protein D0907_20810 [Pseudoalteromonas donghaensis]
MFEGKALKDIIGNLSADLPDTHFSVEAHHQITDLLPSEMVEIIKNYFEDLTIQNILTVDGIIQRIECATSTFTVDVIALTDWNEESPCGELNIVANFSEKYRFINLITINEINESVPGLKLFRKNENLHSSTLLTISFGVTAQTLINQINYLLETTQRLQLSLFDEKSNSVN